MIAGVAVLLLAAVQPQFTQVSKQAAEARTAGRIPEAIVLYQKAVQLRPGWAEGWWYAGALLYQQRRFPEAAAALERYLKIEPKSAAGRTMMGLAEFGLKNYRSALELLMSGESLPPSELSNIARYHRAILKTRAGQFEAAFDELKRFPFLNVETPAVIEASGIAGLRMPILPADLPEADRALVMKTGRALYDCWAVRIIDADREFRDLILTWPANPHVRYLAGAFFLDARQEDGIRELEKCLELDPAYVPAMLQIAFAYLKWGEPAKGLSYAGQAAKLQPDSFVPHVALGRILTGTGDLDRAIRELETAVKLAPDQAECHFALATAYGKAGREADAAREKSEFTKIDNRKRQGEK